MFLSRARAWFHICIHSFLSIDEAAQVWECVDLFQEGSAQHHRFFVDCIDLQYLRLRRRLRSCICCQVRESRAGSSSKLPVVQPCPESPLNAILLFLCGLTPCLLVWKHAKTKSLRRFLAGGFLGCCRITFKNLASCNQEAEPIQFYFFHVLHLICLQCFNLYLVCKIICRGPKMWTAKNKSEASGLAKAAKLLPFYSISFISSYWLHFLPPLRRVHTTVFIIM